MHFSALALGEQIFTHIDDQTGQERVFAVDGLRKHMDSERAKFFITPIDYTTSVMIMKHRGIEKPRLRRAMQTKLYKPFLYLQMPDQTNLLCDGSHTYVARHMKGHKWGLTYVIPQEIWKHYLVEGIPQWESEAAMLASYSGVQL
jgi:hypothetical protein